MLATSGELQCARDQDLFDSACFWTGRYTGCLDFVIQGGGESLRSQLSGSHPSPIHLWITVRPWLREDWGRTAPSWPTRFRPSALRSTNSRPATSLWEIGRREQEDPEPISEALWT